MTTSQQELLRQLLTSLLRHALMAAGAALAATGWVAPGLFEQWINAHMVEIVGLVLMALAQAWSWLHKRETAELLRTALHLPPTLPDGQPATAADVRRVVAQRRSRRAALSALLCLALLCPTGCWGGGAAAALRDPAPDCACFQFN